MNIIHKVSLRVIAIFMVAILSSFIPDTFPEFFGDVKCQGNVYTPYKGYVGCQLAFVGYENVKSHGPDVHWGARHILWTWMGSCLAFVQFVGIVVMIYNHLEDESRRTKETL